MINQLKIRALSSFQASTKSSKTKASYKKAIIKYVIFLKFLVKSAE